MNDIIASLSQKKDDLLPLTLINQKTEAQKAKLKIAKSNNGFAWISAQPLLKYEINMK